MLPAHTTVLQERPAHAPAFGVVQVPPTMLGRVIGTGGANLRELEEERDARVDVADDGACL
jgi:polyribonucleotide nucleotidyltransferase